MSNNRLRKKARRQGKPTDNFQDVLMDASRAHQNGDLARAEKGYLQVLKTQPDWGQLLNALGTVYLDQQKWDKATLYFEKATALSPAHLPACYNLARLLQWQNKHDEALTMYLNIVELQPENGETWNNLGIAHRETGNRDEAKGCFEKAVHFAPDMAEAWNNLGVSLDESSNYAQAVKAYNHALELRPDYTSAHFNLGSSLQKLNRCAEAEEHYKEVLKINPEDAAASFMLQSLSSAAGAASGAAVTPDAAPVDHVRRIFDQCAGTFEKVLVQDLEYRTPELLFNLVRPYLQPQSNVLDLGCGTGLGADFYRPFASRLTGVDLSAKMLARASAKNIYDSLQEFDLLQDWNFPQQFNLIYSADVFVYFGKLDKIISSISAALLPNGLVAFSVEKLEEPWEPTTPGCSYRLNPTGRYAHSPRYISDCLKQHGLQLLEQTEEVIRKQSGESVKGLLFVAGKNA